jgi:hypothetical protein
MVDVSFGRVTDDADVWFDFSDNTVKEIVYDDDCNSDTTFYRVARVRAVHARDPVPRLRPGAAATTDGRLRPAVVESRLSIHVALAGGPVLPLRARADRLNKYKSLSPV